MPDVYFNIDCNDVPAVVPPINNPFNPTSLLNPLFVDDPSFPTSGFSILIYLGNVAYEFTKFYNPPTMTIEDNRGFERGQATFTITDFSPTNECLPFIPPVDAIIEIWNFSRDDLFFRGKITDVSGNLIVRRCNLTEVTGYEIRAHNKSSELERKLVSEHYTNVKTGFILRDLIRRFTFFDYTDIDPTMGQTIIDVRFSRVYVADCIQRILDLEPTWVFWIDALTNKAQAGDASVSLNTILNAVEAPWMPNDVYALFDAPSLKLSYDTSIIRNHVEFFYNGLYSAGTVSVSPGDDTVFGQNTEFTRYVKEGAKFRINSSTAEYTVEKVLNDLSFRLSSEYKEPLETAVPYTISGSRMVIVVEDTASIARMAAINNEVGPLAGLYEYIVPADSNSYTRDEAFQIANSHLLKYSQPLIKGEATSDNTKIPLTGMMAGQVVHFELPTSRKMSVDAVIQRFVRKDTGGIICREETDPLDTRIDPFMIYSFDFQDRIFDVRNQIKRLMADVRRNGIKDDADVEEVKIVTENVFIDDCVALLEPLQIGGDNGIGGDLNELEFSDSFGIIPPVEIIDEFALDDLVTMRVPAPGPYYTLPTPRQEGYCLGATKDGFTS